jgi:hypothetical protein
MFDLGLMLTSASLLVCAVGVPSFTPAEVVAHWRSLIPN